MDLRLPRSQIKARRARRCPRRWYYATDKKELWMEILVISSKIAAILAVQMFNLTMMVSMRRVDLGKSEGDIAKYP